MVLFFLSVFPALTVPAGRLAIYSLRIVMSGSVKLAECCRGNGVPAQEDPAEIGWIIEAAFGDDLFY